MSETTTTDVVTQEPGAEIAQPVEQPTEAVQNTDPETTNTNDSVPTETDSTSTDDGLDDWAKNKGLELDSDNARKAAKMAREAEKGFHNKAQKASELEKQLSQPELLDDDPIKNEVYNYIKTQQVKDTTRDFFDRNPEAKALEQDMAAYITSDATKAQLVREGYLSLDDVYAIVSSNPNRANTLKAEGRKEGLQELANKQRATAVNGSASNSAPAPKLSRANAETWWESLGAEGRANPENRRQLDQLLS